MEKAAPVFGQYVSAANCKWRARADIYMAGLVSCRLLCRAGSQKRSAPGHLPEYQTETESHRDYTGPVPRGPVRAAIHKPRPEGGRCRAREPAARDCLFGLGLRENGNGNEQGSKAIYTSINQEL